MIGAFTVASMVISRLVNWAFNAAETALSTVYVENVIIPQYEKLDLYKVLLGFVKDRETRDKLIKLFREDPAAKRAYEFTEFLKNFNLNMAREAIGANIISPRAGEIATRLLSAISWSFGFGWLSWVALSPILGKLISEPTRQKLDELFPDKDLTKSEIEKLYRLGKFDENSVRLYLSKLGYKEEAINHIINILKSEKVDKERDLTKTDILRAYREGLIDANRATIELEKLGYSRDEINILLALEDRRKSVSKKVKEKELSTSTILKAYKENVIDRETAKEKLKRLGYDDEETEILLKLADLDKNVEKHVRNRDLTKTDILTAFRLGLLNFDMAKRYLMEIGYDEDEAELLLAITYVKYIMPKEQQKTP